MKEEPKVEKVDQEVVRQRNPIAAIIVGLVGAFSAIYLLNPTAGIVELIPDNIPFLGNLDEAAAVTMLISCLAYFGVDLGALFGRKKKEDSDIIDVEAEND